MLAYVIVSKSNQGESDILGVFTEQDKAKLYWREYIAENPEAECWIEPHDADIWMHETKHDLKIVHKSMVNKTTGIMSHVICFSGEELPAESVEEGQGWYTIRQVLDTLDEEEGKEKNLQLLETYMQKKKEQR